MTGFTLIATLLAISATYGKNIKYLNALEECPPTNIPGEDVFFPAEDCQHYYQCDHGQPILRPCPSDQEWSQELERCELPEVAECSVGMTHTHGTTTPTIPTTTKPTTPTTQTPGQSGCPPYNTPGKDAFLPAEDCQHFYKCDHGKPVLIPCPAGQEWSQALERCDWPEVAQCSVGTTPTNPTTASPTTPTTTKPTSPTTTNPGPSGCPPYNTPGKDVFLPAEDCQHFYKCDHGKPVLIPCPAGQEWSQALGRCEWPEVAQCSVTPSKPHNPPPTAGPTTTKPGPSGCPPYNTPGKDAFLPAEDCQHFYKCDHGKPVLIPCPPGQEWSQALERCDWPEVAQCSVGTTPTNPTTASPTTPTTTKPTSPTTTNPGPSGCPPYNTPGKDVFLPAEDCQHFYKCDHRKPVLIPCPAGQEWSQALERCDWPEVAQCSVGTTPTNPTTASPTTPTTTKPTSPTTTNPGPSGCPPYNTPGKDVFLPAEDCQHFYKCDHGKPVLIPCPAGQEWSQALGRCEWPEVAQCSVTPSKPYNPPPTAGPTTTKPGPSGCPPYNTPGKDAFLPAEDCQHFYKCDHGKPVLIPCPPGQEWSQALERCDWPEVAQCSVGTTPTNPTTASPTTPTTTKPTSPTTTNPGPSGCPPYNTPGKDVFLPAEDCQHFYKCDHGKPVLIPCPAGQEWSQALERCEWPEVAQCSVTTSKPHNPTPTAGPTTTKPGPSGCPPYNTPGKDAFLPAEDCQHFYKCDHGKPVLIPCPPGQEWSQVLERCDWPEVSQCSVGTTSTNPTTASPTTPTTTKPTSPTTSNPGPSGCPPYNTPGKDVFIPAEDCQHFYKCDHGKPVLIPCPAGQEWSQALERCDWPEVAQCSVGTTPTNPTTASPTTPTTTPTSPTTTNPGPSGCPPYNTPGKDVFLPAEDCQHFYKCDHGKPVLIPCPAGQEWSQALERCEWPEVAQCSITANTQTPIPTTSSPTNKPVYKNCPPYNGMDVMFPAEDCNHFYKCDHGKPVLMACPSFLHWSDVDQRCEWPLIARCSTQ